MSSVGNVSPTPCAQLAVTPMSTTELIKTQLAQYITEIQQWQMSLCQSSSTDMVPRCSELWFCLQRWHWWKWVTTVLGTEQYMRSSKLVMIAQDLISAPASQAFIEVCFRYAAYTYSCMPQQYATIGRNARVFQVKSASASTYWVSFATIDLRTACV